MSRIAVAPSPAPPLNGLRRRPQAVSIARLSVKLSLVEPVDYAGANTARTSPSNQNLTPGSETTDSVISPSPIAFFSFASSSRRGATSETPIGRAIWIVITWLLIASLGFLALKLQQWLRPGYREQPISTHGQGPQSRTVVDVAAAVEDAPAAPGDSPPSSTAYVRLHLEGTAPKWNLTIDANEYYLWPEPFQWTAFKAIRGHVFCRTMGFTIGTFELKKRLRDLNNFDLFVRMEDGRSIEAHLKPSN